MTHFTSAPPGSLLLNSHEWGVPLRISHLHSGQIFSAIWCLEVISGNPYYISPNKQWNAGPVLCYRDNESRNIWGRPFPKTLGWYKAHQHKYRLASGTFNGDVWWLQFLSTKDRMSSPKLISNCGYLRARVNESLTHLSIHFNHPFITRTYQLCVSWFRRVHLMLLGTLLHACGCPGKPQALHI